MKVKIGLIESEKPVAISFMNNDQHTFVYLSKKEAEELCKELMRVVNEINWKQENEKQ